MFSMSFIGFQAGRMLEKWMGLALKLKSVVFQKMLEC